MKKHYAFIFSLVFFFAVNASAAEMERVVGEGCFTYGDNDTPRSAAESALSLAKREAIEGYKSFITSSSKVKDYQIEEDLIDTLASGYLYKLKVLEEKEEGRTICKSIEAYVDPVEIDELIEKFANDKAAQADSNTETTKEEPAKEEKVPTVDSKDESTETTEDTEKSEKKKNVYEAKNKELFQKVRRKVFIPEKYKAKLKAALKDLQEKEEQEFDVEESSKIAEASMNEALRNKIVRANELLQELIAQLKRVKKTKNKTEPTLLSRVMSKESIPKRYKNSLQIALKKLQDKDRRGIDVSKRLDIADASMRAALKGKMSLATRLLQQLTDDKRPQRPQKPVRRY